MLQRLVGAAPTRRPEWPATIKMRTERLPPAEGNGTAGGAPEGLVPTVVAQLAPDGDRMGARGGPGVVRGVGAERLKRGCASLSRAP